MSQLLTMILSRAVPKVRVESATVVRASSGLYWILVRPNHYGYWERFRETYSYGAKIAFSKRATKESIARGFCPEFVALEGLFEWLSDVLKLTQGERKLLLLCGGSGSCLGF